MHQQIGSYQLVERLGVGGMAEVFLAHARHEGETIQPCVVKVLHRELSSGRQLTRMLLDEARLVARLRHNNIASLYDVGRHGDQIYLVMEYIAGRDLHSVLMQAGRSGHQIPIAFAVHVARRICTGLHYAHTRLGADGQPLQLVHRDVSPPNVLVSTVGEIKLIDFGVAKFNSELRLKTSTGVIKGKFGYMSPEQAFDESLDRRSDIFAVGVCLYEMLTGRALYGHSDDPGTMLERARTADIKPVQKWRADVPADLATVVHKALQRDRDDRFQTAHHMERQLTRVLAQLQPDYTDLDAGAFIDELFDLEEPALQQISPRLDLESTDQYHTGDKSPPNGRDSDESPSVDFDEGQTDQLPQQRFDDFEVEKTEIITDNAIDSGAQPAYGSSQDYELEAASTDNSEVTDDETQVIEQWRPQYRADTDVVQMYDSENSEEQTDSQPVKSLPSPQQDPEDVPPTPVQDRNVLMGNKFGDNEQALDTSGSADTTASGSAATMSRDQDSVPAQQHSPAQEIENPAPVHNYPGASAPSVPSTGKQNTVDTEDGPIDYRAQILAGLVFVVIAVLFVASRLF